MRQRFGVALALLGQPSLIIVDEPTSGLDPEERIRFLNMLGDLGEDAVVILSTHIVADVAALCRRVAILHQGEVRLSGDPRALAGPLGSRLWQKVIPRGELEAISSSSRVISTLLQHGQVLVHVEADRPPADGFRPAIPDLEDVYLATVGAGSSL
jgi:ABC-type multidrug transport system ATPase subunit